MHLLLTFPDKLPNTVPPASSSYTACLAVIHLQPAPMRLYAISLRKKLTLSNSAIIEFFFSLNLMPRESGLIGVCLSSQPLLLTFPSSLSHLVLFLSFLLHFAIPFRKSARYHKVMRPLSFITLFSSCVSTLVLQPLITPAPQLAVRDVASNICGYYSLYGLRTFSRALPIHLHG